MEDDANNMQLDKEDTQQTNLNGKYLSVTLVFNKLKCKVRFDIAVGSPSKHS